MTGSLLKDYPGIIEIKKPLAPLTTMKVGGQAEMYAEPAREEEALDILTRAEKEGIRWRIIGGGSNIIVVDGVLQGLVVNLGRCCSEMKVKGAYIETGSGVMLPRLSRLAEEKELTGLEFAFSIPGTVGGAVRGNAGMGELGEMKDLIQALQVWIPGKGRTKLPASHIHFGYRTSSLKNQKNAILKVFMQLSPGDKKEIEKIKKKVNERRKGHPTGYPSAGSIFKNPPGYYAGQLIEEAGLLGVSVGGAQISQQHGNFIINKGGARAGEVLNLVDMVRERVAKTRNINLDLEVEVWDNC